MSKGINKVILIGNLGHKPELNATKFGSVCSISLATQDSWKDKETGELKEQTQWHKVVFYSRLAEIAEQYLDKGAKVYVEGRLFTRKWLDKSGKENYTTEIIAKELQMLGNNKANPANLANPVNHENKLQAEQYEKLSNGNISAYDEDVPF